jgi:hypothetical protein
MNIWSFTSTLPYFFAAWCWNTGALSSTHSHSLVSFTLQPLYPQGKSPGTQWLGGWVGSRAGLDAVVKRKIPSPLPGIEPTILSPAFRYGASIYTGPHWCITVNISIYIGPHWCITVNISIYTGPHWCITVNISIYTGPHWCITVNISSFLATYTCRATKAPL